MKLIDVGGEAYGVIAVGQQATGIFALGQVAIGVVAVGQGAVGLFVLGQGAVGLLAIGQGTIGLIWGAGMVGVGGRGFGLFIPLTPSLGPHNKLPQPRTLDAVRAAGEGWLLVTVESGPQGAPVLHHEERRLSARMDVRLRDAARAAIGRTLFAHFRHDDENNLVCDRLMERPVSRLFQARWWAIWTVQLIGLVALAIGYWSFVIEPLIDIIRDLLFN